MRKIINVQILSHKEDIYKYIKLTLQYIFKNLCFLSLIQTTTLNVCNLYSNFKKLLKNRVPCSTIAPGKSDGKNVHLREKYKGTKFPNESNFIA